MQPPEFVNLMFKDLFRSRSLDPSSAPESALLQIKVASAFAHALCGLLRAARANLLLDTGANIGVDALPVFERTGQHRLTDPSQKAPGHLVHKGVTLRIIEYLADENPRLAEVVIIAAQVIGATHHGAIGLPTVVDRPGLVRPLTAIAIGRIDGR